MLRWVRELLDGISAIAAVQLPSNTFIEGQARQASRRRRPASLVTPGLVEWPAAQSTILSIVVPSCAPAAHLQRALSEQTTAYRLCDRLELCALISSPRCSSGSGVKNSSLFSSPGTMQRSLQQSQPLGAATPHNAWAARQNTHLAVG